MKMREKRTSVIEGRTGKRFNATLLTCPDCYGEPFCCFFPDGVTHVHFQCLLCGASFCDGCHGEDIPPRDSAETKSGGLT
jgi:hypothetical protein